jgi:VanZ family protein
LTQTSFRRLWIGAVLGLAAFIVYASLSPQPPVPTEIVSDKVGHYLAYLSLALLGSGITSPGRLWRTLLRCFLLGAALEIAQALFTEHRLAEWGDLAADVAGILTAWLVAGQGRAGWGLRAAARFQGKRRT